MFSLEKELENREKLVSMHSEKVADLIAKEEAYNLAKLELEKIGDVNELLADIKIIKGYLGINDEIVAEEIAQPEEQSEEEVSEVVPESATILERPIA